MIIVMRTSLRLLFYLFTLLVLIIPVFIWFFAESPHQISPILFGAFMVQVVAVVILQSLFTKTNEQLKNSQTQISLASSEQFVSLYERSPIPYLSLDVKGCVVMFNPAAVRLFETTNDNILGLKFSDYLTLEDENDLSMLLGKLFADHTIVDQEVQLHTEKGSLRWLLLSVYVYELGEQRLVSMIDITHQKAVDAAKTDFVALATHQLRTPIAAIRWNVELLMRNLASSKTEAQANYLTKIDRNVMRMLALINDFLSVSKLEMGTFATSSENINLTEFSDSIVDEYDQKFVESKIFFERSDNPPNLNFVSDPRLLHIIISNLLSNAVKYVPPEGKIKYQYELVGNELVITVADSGIGIPSDELDKLFTKFFRARNAYSHQASGTGLGLYIVKQSAEKLGGSISVTSEENIGTTFVVRLPYQA